MKIGLTLPQFREDPEPALDTARRAEAAGLDGVFVFDHMWPLGQPHRPALYGQILAGALLGSTERLAVGTLVARVGLLPDAVLVNNLVSLARIAGDRLIAGLGIGDAMSRPENAGAGAPFLPRSERLARLAEVCRRLRARGITTWVGGTSAAVRALALAEADAANLWGVPPETLATDAAAESAAGKLTWAGQVDLGTLGAAEITARLQTVAAAGASWAVLAPLNRPWPEAVETIAAAAGALVH